MELPGFTLFVQGKRTRVHRNLHSPTCTPARRRTALHPGAGDHRQRPSRAQAWASGDEVRTAALCKGKCFRTLLGGHELLINRSFLAQFPGDSMRQSGATNDVVLLGDAAHRALVDRFLEPSSALEDARSACTPPSRVIPTISTRRAARLRPPRATREADRIQHSANVSLVWFENVRRFWNMPSGAVQLQPDEPLQGHHFSRTCLRDAGCVAELEDWWNARWRRPRRAACPAGWRRHVRAFPPARDMRLRKPGGGLADGAIHGEGRSAQRLAPGALRRARRRQH